MKSIGIDLGTTSLSFHVVDASARAPVEQATLESVGFLPSSNPWERAQDGDAIAAKAQAVLDGLLRRHPDTGAIGLTGQMHGILYVDGAGRACGPLFTWQDGRAAQPGADDKSVCQRLGERGLPTPPGYGLATHLANRERGLVPPQAAALCTIADYLGLRLTGRKRPLLHASQAASLGLFDTQRLAFLPEAAELAGRLLPQVTGEPALLGEYRGVPVSVSLGDNQASYLGSVRRAGDTLLVNIGTGGQISLLSPRAAACPGIEARPFLEGYTLLVGATLCGGAAYAALEGFFRAYAQAAGAPDVPQYEVMARLLEQRPDLCWNVRTSFAGTRQDPFAAGSITGLRREDFHPAGLIRGVLEGMAQELWELYNAACRAVGAAPARMLASGNAVGKNPALRAILERRFALPLELVPVTEEAALGAALFGLGAVEALSLTDWLGLRSPGKGESL